MREIFPFAESSSVSDTRTEFDGVVIRARIVVHGDEKRTHEYFGVDLRIIWDTVHEDLPGLAEDLEEVLKAET